MSDDYCKNCGLAIVDKLKNNEIVFGVYCQCRNRKEKGSTIKTIRGYQVYHEHE